MSEFLFSVSGFPEGVAFGSSGVESSPRTWAGFPPVLEAV